MPNGELRNRKGLLRDDDLLVEVRAQSIRGLPVAGLGGVPNFYLTQYSFDYVEGKRG